MSSLTRCQLSSSLPLRLNHVLIDSVTVQVIVSPVVEPPSQSGVTTGFTGTTLYSQLSTVFGYLNSAGYCSSATVCKRFPILLDFGSALNTLDDQLFMNDLADYMTLYGLGTPQS